MACIGESEDAMKELLNKLERGLDVSGDIEGWVANIS